MESRCVRELMIPLRELPSVLTEATLSDMLAKFDEIQQTTIPGHHSFENVLVIDDSGRAVGKIGPHALLQALEPKYMEMEDLHRLSRFGLTSDLLSSMISHYKLLDGDINDLWNEARNRKVKDIMHPITESIEWDATMADVIHRLIMWNTASLIVTRDGQAIGLIRVNDLLRWIVSRVRVSETGKD